MGWEERAFRKLEPNAPWLCQDCHYRQPVTVLHAGDGRGGEDQVYLCRRCLDAFKRHMRRVSHPSVRD